MTIIDDLIIIQRLYGCCPHAQPWFVDVNYHYMQLENINKDVEIGITTNAWINPR